ncbi:glycosyltransferase [Patescibacteria group bacterium]|nr:MAG: glycosyltransferase [Patescibacteria group bacterium]
MKIAMIGQKGVPAVSGGIERHVEELSVELAARGHEVLVFCRSWYTGRKEREYAHRGVRCLTVPSIRTKHLDAITHAFLAIVRAAREDADVFHIHGVGPALLSWLPKLLRPRAAVLVTFHCIDRHHQKWNLIARMALHLGEWMSCYAPDATIAVSKTLQSYCRLSYSADTVYVPNGARAPEWTDVSLLEAFDLVPGKYLMFCARLVRHKGAHLLVEAWKALRERRPDIVMGWKLAIVGGGAFTDGYVDELRASCEDDDSIVLTGPRSGIELSTLFAHAAANVHPSDSEGLPLAILEAMSHGKAVLSSDIPENRELTEEHGLVFRRADARDLAIKLEWILTHPDEARMIGREARVYVARSYDWGDIADTTGYLYEAALAERTWQEAT